MELKPEATAIKITEIETLDGICDAYVACPNTGQHPAVLLFMDAFGLRPAIFAMADKIAEQGYYVLAPNFFYRWKKSPLVDFNRLKDADYLSKVFEVLSPYLSSYTPELAMRDAGSFLDFLKKNDSAKFPAGVVGYCMGGGVGLRMAAQYAESVACLGSFHAGRLATDAENSPHLMAPEIEAECYFAHADNDRTMPEAQIKKLEEALTAAQVDYKSEIYRGAMHGFTMKDLPAYNEEADDRHWEALFALLRRNLVR